MIHIEATKADRADDISRFPCDNLNDSLIFVAQEEYRGAGYRIIEFKEGTGGELRAGSKAVLRHSGSDGTTTETEYDTLADAEAAIDLWHDSDGGELIDLEQPLGSAPSIVLWRQPRLWRVEDEFGETDIAFGRVIGRRINEYGRTDQDRF